MYPWARLPPERIRGERAVNDMSADDGWKLATRGEWLVVLALLAAAIPALALGEIKASKRQLAQATPQPQQQSTPPTKNDVPAESKPGGTRPTTPAPEPANPDTDAQEKVGQPVQPQRPAEKYGPPIREKDK